MKKLFALLLALALVLSFCAVAEEDFRTVLNPNGYTVIEISDVFIGEDEPYDDEEGEEETETPDDIIIQACFGDVDMSNGEENTEFVGFDQEEIRALELKDDAIVIMPADPFEDPTNETEMTAKEFIDWFDAQKETYDNELSSGTKDNGDPDIYTALASFEMNEEGELTKIEYFYLP